jgi:hypothetical protein
VITFKSCINIIFIYTYWIKLTCIIFSIMLTLVFLINFGLFSSNTYLSDHCNNLACIAIQWSITKYGVTFLKDARPYRRNTLHGEVLYCAFWDLHYIRKIADFKEQHTCITFCFKLGKLLSGCCPWRVSTEILCAFFASPSQPHVQPTEAPKISLWRLWMTDMYEN